MATIQEGFGIIGQLRKAGLVDKYTRRVIIDIPWDGVAVIYRESLSDENHFEIIRDIIGSATKIIEVSK